MKKLITSIAIMAALSTVAMAQSEKKEKMKTDFVYELPQMDMLKRLPTLKAYLNVMEGVEFKGYCESRKLLMLKADTWKTQQITDLFEQMELIYFKKENTSVEQAITACESKEEVEFSKTVK